MTDRDSPTLTEPVLTAVNEFIERVSDDGPFRKQASTKVADCCRHTPEQVETELNRITTLLEATAAEPSPTEPTDTGAPETPAEASRLLYGLVAANFTALTDQLSEPIWEALGGAAVAARQTGPASKYARRLLWELPVEELADVDESKYDVLSRWFSDPLKRRLAAGVCHARNYDQEYIDDLGDCLTESDVWTRRIAAKALDYHTNWDHTEGSHGMESFFDQSPIADQLLAATDDEDPQVQVHAIAALCAPGIGEDDDWGSTALQVLSEAVLANNPFVRRRAEAVLINTRGMISTDTAAYRAASAETKGRLLQGVVQMRDDEIPPGKYLARSKRQIIDETPAAGTFTVRETLWRVGWEGAGHGNEGGRTTPQGLARRALTQAVEDDPTGGADPSWYVEQLLAERDETVTQYGARILRALAPHAPDEVANAVDILEQSLEFDEQSKASRQSALALSALARERPTAVSVDRSTILDAYGDIIKDGRHLNVDDAVSLVEVDQVAGTAALRDLCAHAREHDDLPSYFDRDLGKTIEQVAEEHPTVLREVVDDIIEAEDAIDNEKLDRIFRGFQALAEGHVEPLIPHANTIFAHLTDVPTDTRHEAALLLRELGKAREDAIPQRATPLLAPEAGPESDHWPVGTITAAYPDFGRQAIKDGVALIQSDKSGSHFAGKQLGELIVEVYHGDSTVALEEIRQWLDVGGLQRARASVVRNEPEIALALVDDAVEIVATTDDNAVRHRVCIILKEATKVDPEAVQTAITNHYQGPEEFINDYDPDQSNDCEVRYRHIARDAGFDL